MTLRVRKSVARDSPPNSTPAGLNGSRNAADSRK